MGTVVAYNLIRREGAKRGWQVPQLVTVGSPLAIHEIRRTLKRFDTIRCPEVVSAWFNAYDPRDVVALFPLDVDHFELDPTKPSIVNKGDVQNKTDNRHGIAGYLDDKDVAQADLRRLDRRLACRGPRQIRPPTPRRQIAAISSSTARPLR